MLLASRCLAVLGFLLLFASMVKDGYGEVSGGKVDAWVFEFLDAVEGSRPSEIEKAFRNQKYLANERQLLDAAQKYANVANVLGGFKARKIRENIFGDGLGRNVYLLLGPGGFALLEVVYIRTKRGEEILQHCLSTNMGGDIDKILGGGISTNCGL